MEQSEKLVPVFMPTLATLLLRAEHTKGAPLTYGEVVAVRDSAICVMTPQSVAEGIEENRGYRDIDPESCWDEWNALRKEFVEGTGEGEYVIGPKRE